MITLALATRDDHLLPAEAMGIKTCDWDAAVRNVVAAGGTVVADPPNDARERRSVVRDDHGNALVAYAALPSLRGSIARRLHMRSEPLAHAA